MSDVTDATASASEPPFSTAANDPSAFMADSTTDRRAGRSPAVVISGESMISRTRERMYAPASRRSIDEAAMPRRFNSASSIMANNPCTNGSSLSGRVTLE